MLVIASGSGSNFVEQNLRRKYGYCMERFADAEEA